MVGVRGRARVLGLFVGVVLVLAACASKAEPGAGGATGSGQAGQLATRSIAGVGAVLQAPNGFTLYRLTSEANGKIACTQGCATTWPPLIAASGKVPAASADLAGHLGTIKRPDGTVQVTFDGMPLYTYAGDSRPGEAKGQGVGGVWFAVTATAGSSSPPAYPGY